MTNNGCRTTLNGGNHAAEFLNSFHLNRIAKRRAITMNRLETLQPETSNQPIAHGLKPLFSDQVYYSTFCNGQIATVIPGFVSNMCPPGYDVDDFRERIASEFERGYDGQVIVIECSTTAETWEVRILRDEDSVLATSACIGEVQPAEPDESPGGNSESAGQWAVRQTGCGCALSTSSDSRESSFHVHAKTKSNSVLARRT